MRGGEKVVESLCRLLPSADIFTLFYDAERVSPLIRSRRVTASFLNPLRRQYRNLLPLMPMALERFDLREYDLVISSESGPAKGVLVSSNTRHICYCHTPMRYLWDLYAAYVNDWTQSRLKRALIAPLSSYLRMWDYASAARVDQFVANSRNVQKRIWKTYRRPADVVYPPVQVSDFYSAAAGDYYLVVSELVAYKRIADVVSAFTATGRRLKITGSGPEYSKLRKMAGPTIEFTGRLTDTELRHLYAHCRAVLLPGEEDFGIVPVEALASGKAVIALGRGGVLESVPSEHPRAGFFYSHPCTEHLKAAIETFEQHEGSIKPRELQNCASCFSEERFRAQMERIISLDSESERDEPAVAAPGAESTPANGATSLFYKSFTSSSRQ
jgi:glycosyltransferase involved in cell wall biosynthesis